MKNSHLHLFLDNGDFFTIYSKDHKMLVIPFSQVELLVIGEDEKIKSLYTSGDRLFDFENTDFNSYETPSIEQLESYLSYLGGNNE